MKRLFMIILCCLLAIGLMGCSTNEGNNEVSEPTPDEINVEDISQPEETVVTLYFGNEDGYLRKELRTVNWVPSAENGGQLVEELIKGTQDTDNTLNVIPEGTKLLNYQFDAEQGRATVDFSEHVLGAAGSMGEIFVVYSVVNTLTELPGVENVMFLVEGKEVETIAGHIYTGEPIERDINLLEGNALK
ncbi:MAG: GerMN domain-containing protein [Peptococcales bacterium]|jgi:germination protein M